MSAFKRTVLFVVAVAVVLLLLSIRIVSPGEVGVVVRMGKAIRTLEPGVHVVGPWPFYKITKYPTHVVTYQTTDDHNKDGKLDEKDGSADYLDYPIEIKTEDGQTAYVYLNVNCRVKPQYALKIRQDIARSSQELVDRVIKFYVRSVTRNKASYFSAEELYTHGRLQYQNEVLQSLREKTEPVGIEIVDVALRDVNFSPEYEEAIEQQQIARERIETAQYEAEVAKHEAERQKELAKGEAEAQVILAEAEAKSIEVRGKALKKYPQVIQLNFIEALKAIDWMMVPSNGMEWLLPLPNPESPAPTP